VLGITLKSIKRPDFNCGGKELRKEGMYSDGPQNVYNKLNPEPCPLNNSKSFPTATKNKELQYVPIFLPSTTLRKHHSMVHSLKARKQNLVSSTTIESVDITTHVNESDEEGINVVVRRSSLSKSKVRKNFTTSISSAGDILCCSPLNSSDINNCNQIFLKKFEQEVAAKVWHGALGLGVELGTMGEKQRGFIEANNNKVLKCIHEIKGNEIRDEVESIRREHKQSCLK
jgi:hypothetical protein